MPEEITGYGKKGMAETAEPFEVDRTVMRRATLEFVRAYDLIEDETVRKSLKDLIYSIADSEIEFTGFDDEGDA